ncbi:acyltransferase family protein [Paraglaciecola polaris]|uniref:Acyltransferase 3 n=1 Tax=Paraglaciecola polaris LMG 21857 TaxID=1129793 RepID=K6Z4Y1_9ALTE|nr:acyltransferase family protein [Paraglaciecola polaris]GAC31266.1 hypothetical protein GPLA_0347 [Paraglaciecola polaris LMG 21857]
MSTKNYRWDIQGLRALAVMAVVIFHISPNRLPGGYLGVDIFFVISGYLIIGFICRDLRAEKFSLSDFYLKRIRRLFPALLATVIATMIAAYCYLLPEEMTLFAKSVISTLLYVSNMFFYTQSDYFAADLKFAPLLHTWSLSVEEQFYILFPILLIGIMKYKPKALQLFLGVIAVLSFVLSEYLVRTDPSLSFFISPTRFWQFIVGGLLALNLHKMGLSKTLSNVIGFGGLAALIICLFRYDEATLFPGISAIVPTLATLCVIWAGSVTGVFSKLMALPINKFFGNISYSLYLWHWPVIVFYTLNMNHEYSKLAHELILLLVSVVLGYLSWRFIELPFSAKRLALSKGKNTSKTLISSFALSSALILVMAFSLDGLPNRFNEQQLIYSSYMNYDRIGYRRGSCFLRGTDENLSFYDKKECINFDDNKYNILLIGDSHTAQWNSAITELLLKNQTLTQLTSSGCRPVLPLKGQAGCIEIMSFGFNELVRSVNFDKIIIAGRWKDSDFNELSQTVNYLTDYTDKVIVVGRTLEYKQDLPRLLATTGPDGIESGKQYDYSYFKHMDVKFRQVTKNNNKAFYVSLIDILCQATESVTCQTLTKENLPIAFDYGHYTHQGALEVAKQWNEL